VPNPSSELIQTSGYLREGFAEHYDRYRPAPPAALLDVLTAYARVDRPVLVVDLGSGTGLSTRAWAARAEEVVGVEPNARMKAVAEQRTHEPNVRYVEAYADATGLPAERADLVTCSQSFHWMDAEPTLAEAARLLRPGGVFAAYDYDWPPSVDWEVEAALEALFERLDGMAVREGRKRFGGRKANHLARLQESGRFRFAREVYLHAVEETDAERLLGLAKSMGPSAALHDLGYSDEEIGFGEVVRVVERCLGGGTQTCWLGYRVRLGVK
jgi:SAM-dependent methyltransferase